jgi:CheY-like chemotaxis protein
MNGSTQDTPHGDGSVVTSRPFAGAESCPGRPLDREMPHSLSKPTILLVEDDENDAFLMERAFGKAGVPVRLQVVRDGREALRYLRGEGDFADRRRFPVPRLVLLDLNLPHVRGLDVLKQIRADPHLRQLLVVVLTSSAADTDVKQAYELGANSYLTKVARLEEVQALVELITQYWLKWNQPPKPLDAKKLT